ncbi:MAG TPA: hypothetical protein PKU97_06955 [Kofleriaceae bacterium]|nr:hypothetical protein [Kofleriaceae bacterium]
MAVSPATPTSTAAIAPSTSGPADFTAQARLLTRVAACGEGPLPPAMDERTVTAHCANIGKRMTEYRQRYFEKARPFFASLVPAAAPKTVVYPSGGGDLLSALVAFPDATEITTISLELAGDPRRIDTLTRPQLARSLSALRADIGGLLSVGSNTSLNLSSSQRNELPAQVSSFLMGLVAGGYEPVSMRVFRLQPDGSVRYLSLEDIAALEAEAAGKRARTKSLKGSWLSPNFSEAFSNVEIQYRRLARPGEAADPIVRVHRHIAWNLSDAYLTDHPELLAHLAAKGKVTMLTKGASYLLWSGGFSKIRDYMLQHLSWMLSDSTGIPPAYASAAGMVQETYGRFTGAFLEGAELHGQKHSNAFRALWQQNPKRALPVRFGYVDLNKQAHLVVTRPR